MWILATQVWTPRFKAACTRGCKRGVPL